MIVVVFDCFVSLQRVQEGGVLHVVIKRGLLAGRNFPNMRARLQPKGIEQVLRVPIPILRPTRELLFNLNPKVDGLPYFSPFQLKGGLQDKRTPQMGGVPLFSL